MRQAMRTAFLVVGLMVIAAIGARPAEAQVFEPGYSSGNIAVVPGKWEGLSCAGGYCAWNGATTIFSGFTNTQVFITGYDIRYDSASAPVRRLSVAARNGTYTSGTGSYGFQIAGELRRDASTADPWTLDIYFVVVLTKSANLKVTDGSATCTAAFGGHCSTSSTVLNAVPAGMSTGGAGLRYFTLEITEGTAGIQVQRLLLDISQASVSGTSVTVPVECRMLDTSATEDMRCSTDFSVVSATPAEVALFSFRGHSFGATDRVEAITSHTPGVAFDGGFLVLRAFDLYFGAANDLWRIAVGYKGFIKVLGDFKYTYFASFAKTLGTEVTDFYSYDIKALEVLTKP